MPCPSSHCSVGCPWSLPSLHAGRSASNLVFNLRSMVQSRQPIATHSFTASCYEPTTIQVTTLTGQA